MNMTTSLIKETNKSQKVLEPLKADSFVCHRSKVQLEISDFKFNLD